MIFGLISISCGIYFYLRWERLVGKRLSKMETDEIEQARRVYKNFGTTASCVGFGLFIAGLIGFILWLPP
jgi:hypothetical protein